MICMGGKSGTAVFGHQSNRWRQPTRRPDSEDVLLHSALGQTLTYAPREAVCSVDVQR